MRNALEGIDGTVNMKTEKTVFFCKVFLDQCLKELNGL